MAFSKASVDRMAKELLGIPEGQADGFGDSTLDHQKNRCCGHSKGSHGDAGCMSIVVNPESLDDVFCSCMQYEGDDHGSVKR
jgi:hypothetical protein